MLLVTIIALALSWYMYAIGWHNTHKAVATFSSFSAGFALFVCLLTLIKTSKEERDVKHFSNISYGIYLVHLPLLPFAKFLLKQMGMDSGLIVLALWLLLTYIAALGVHLVTQRLMTYVNKKYE